MFLRAFRIIRLGFTNFFRNRLLSLAASLIVTLTVFTIAAMVLLNFFASEFVDQINKRVDFQVYLNDKASQQEIDYYITQVKANTDVEAVEFIDKAQALEIWQRVHRYDTRMLNIVSASYNPLPVSIKVKAYDANNIEKIVAFTRNLIPAEQIDNDSYNRNKDTVNNILAMTAKMRVIGIILAIVFILVSILIVLNTLRITIFSRKEEIDVMKLVGATPGFITWPFIIEGQLYAAVATILTLSLLGLISYSANSFVTSFAGFDVFASYQHHFPIILLSAVLSGMLLTYITSYIAVRKYVNS